MMQAASNLPALALDREDGPGAEALAREALPWLRRSPEEWGCMENETCSRSRSPPPTPCHLCPRWRRRAGTARHQSFDSCPIRVIR